MLAALQLKAQGVDLVDLGAGEPDFNTPDLIKQAAIRAIESNLTRYTPSIGLPELRDAIASRYRADFGVDRSRNDILVSVGGKQAVFNVLLALVDPGDEVVIPTPYWVTFPEVVALCGGEPVFVHPDPDGGFVSSADLVRDALTDRTKAIILNSPNNPTGAVIPKSKFLEICELAAEREIYVVSDECYQYFLYDGLQPYSGAAAPKELRPWIVVCGSLSKTYAMTGWRIGYAIGSPEVIRRIGMIQGHQTSNPNTVAQIAAIEALTGPQRGIAEMVQEYGRRRDYIIPALREIPGFRCAAPQGAFYAFPDVRGRLDGAVADSEQFAARLLNDAHVAVTPGSAFGIEGFIRISFAAAGQASLEEAVRRLRNL
jgi:aspartate aminotransferase